MKITVRAAQPSRVKADALAVALFSDGNPSPGFTAVSNALGGVLADMRKRGELRGRDGEVTVVLGGKRLGAKRVIVIGLGARATFSPGAFARYAGLAVRAAGARKLGSLAVHIPEPIPFDPQAAFENATEGALMATFDAAPYRSSSTGNGKPSSVSSLTFIVDKAASVKPLEAAIGRGTIMGEASNIVREMVNLPSNDMTPTHLAKRAGELARKYGLKISVLDRAEMKRLGMGSMLAVAAGADQPPKVIVLEYRPLKNAKTVLGLIGKGITFDTGGISLKPAQDMDAMKGDMAGGATVIGAMAAIAQLRPKTNVVGIVMATDNMPSSKATKPGDIVRAMNGKSIEITNTDAEGRLVLADGLCYARKLGATHLVDVATLTGAAVVALGNFSTAVMSNDRQFVDLFHEATAPYGERYWELPLFPEYGELIKSNIADMKNSGGRQAGTIYGAMFLKEYVDTAPWIHLDIAGSSWTDKDQGHIVKGPTAVAVRPLVRLAEILSERHPHTKADEAAYQRLTPKV
jgi:leucyl aminopeptidase